MAERIKSISFEDFTEVTLRSVVRAMELRGQAQRRFPQGPILVGIIWYPDLIGLPGQALQPGAVVRDVAKSKA
jgi:hypothetical protein